MQISIDELTRNPDKYLDMLEREDIYIARDGKQAARLTKTPPSKAGVAAKLFGILPKDVNLETARAERMNKI